MVPGPDDDAVVAPVQVTCHRQCPDILRVRGLFHAEGISTKAPMS
jgi:hypothetical protein